MKFDKIYQFNDAGVLKFNKLLEGKYGDDNATLEPDYTVLKNSDFVSPIESSLPFDTDDCTDTKTMILSIVDSLGGPSKAQEQIRNREMIMWLTYALLELLIKKKDGKYVVGAKARYVPPYTDRPQKRGDYRHLLSNRLRLYCDFTVDAEFFLTNYQPHVGGELMEELSFRPESYARNIVQLVGRLYSDSNNNQFKRGVGNRTPGKGGASSLFKFLLQMRQVWAIQTMSVDEIYEKLPAHFDRFK